MRILNQNWNLNIFFRTLSKTRHSVLMLDYDGTLAPFQVNRMAAFLYPEINHILENLINKQKTRVVIVSGRKIVDLLQLFKLSKPIEIWGCHGLERLTTDGKYETAKLDKNQIDGLGKAKELFEKLDLTKQTETKVGCVALHWRGLDLKATEFIYKNTVNSLWEIANKHRLGFYNFNGGLELCAPNRNKGFAVNQILSEMPEETISAYLGDDATDEYAFKAIKNKGLGVLVSTEKKLTDADICLENFAELIDFFQQWLGTGLF